MKQLFGLVFFLLTFHAKAELKPNEEGQLVSFELKQSMTRQDILDLWKSRKIPQFIMPVRYGVDIYEVIYMAPWVDGTMIRASGLYFVPKMNAEESLPVAVYHHGTQLERARKPLLETSEQGAVLGLAADGFITLMPDYYGIGSGDKRHLYQHAWSEAMSTVYMLYAIEQLNEELKIQHTSDVYLTGYSQGGHATMAAHKYLQELNDPRFQVVASAPMSGAYDMSGVQAEVMFGPYKNPFYLPYLLVSYQEAYNFWDGDVYELFRAPYDTIIPKYMTGEKSYSEFNKTLPKIPVDMLKPEYVKEFQENPDFIVAQKIAKNDLYQWVPEAPTFLCYCSSDEQVVGENTVVAYNWMKKNGAGNIRKKDVSNHLGHFGCATFTVVEMRFFFDNVRKGKTDKRKGPPLKRWMVNIYKKKKEKQAIEKQKERLRETESLHVDTQN